VQPSKVLVVDDSDLMHRMYSVFLRGVELVHARDGREALERLEQNADVDLVLLDINMPNMNGFELLTELAERGLVPRLPVIVVTTEGREQDAARGLAGGAAAYLTKPFRAEEVRAAIARLPVAPAAGAP
jgi:CheY-like chemotaxis protein